MELSPEDSLRLNVLLAAKPLAIRVDESRMAVHGLGAGGETRVQLNPTGRDDQYIRRVKELISGHVLGSPGGYPIFLQRWTRMGQMRDDSLEQLLMLGEPEAVVAAACAEGLTDELARRAWWAMEDAENARRMLCRPVIAGGSMGPVLATYLVEFLPFETEPEKMIESVRLVLQPGLLAADEVQALWRRAQRKPPYYLGFMASLPDHLPEQADGHPVLEEVGATLTGLHDVGNRLAAPLARVLGEAGQTWLATLDRVLRKPSNQDVINVALDTIAEYFAAVRPDGRVDAVLEELETEAEHWLAGDEEALAILAQAPGLRDALRAVRVLSGLSYGVVRPVFCDTTAIGSLMRRKLEPVTAGLERHLGVLRGGR